MKILLTTDTWVPTINGVVTSTATLRAALTAQGHEVRVLTLSGDSQTYAKDGVTSLGSLDAGLVYPGARMRAPALNRAIRDLIDWHPDVVHSQCEFSTFAPARRIAHAAGAPLIHTYHTVYEDYTHYFSPSRSMGRKMAALFTRMICADCDAVIAPTPKISRLLAGYGVHGPVRIIPTGLDLQRFAVPRDDALHSRRGLPPQSLDDQRRAAALIRGSVPGQWPVLQQSANAFYYEKLVYLASMILRRADIEPYRVQLGELRIGITAGLNDRQLGCNPQLPFAIKVSAWATVHAPKLWRKVCRKYLKDRQ